MDEYIDVFDDTVLTDDAPSGDGAEPVEDLTDGGGVDSSLEDILRDILDGYFLSDEEDGEADADFGEEADEAADPDHKTDHEETSEEDVTADPREDTEEEMENAVGGGSPFFDPEILSEINNELHRHADEVSGFMSNVTVSGNAVMVSFDDDSASMLRETMVNQSEAMERLDHMSGLIAMVLFVLLFDLIHRFAKRIIKNLMRGDEKNAANS